MHSLLLKVSYLRDKEYTTYPPDTCVIWKTRVRARARFSWLFIPDLGQGYALSRFGEAMGMDTVVRNICRIYIQPNHQCSILICKRAHSVIDWSPFCTNMVPDGNL